MLARALGATPWGIDAHPVEVEVDSYYGVRELQLVGLPDAAVRESRERVRSAIRNCGFKFQPHSVVINLAPADLRKEGNHLDLPIALAYLAANNKLPPYALERRLFCGELALDGSIRPVRGALAIEALARSMQVRETLLPAEIAAQAACLEGSRVVPVSTLSGAIEHLVGAATIERACAAPPAIERGQPDLCEVRGQALARRALEIAAAGGHNLLFCGPPGSGKTMLARRLPGILPPLDHAEAITVTKVQSMVNDRPASGLVTTRPFRSPHAGISTPGLVGGGSVPRPGEVSLAHAGVLFLDELPEFRRDALEALRQPLEDGRVTVVRARARFTFPARFALVAAMNPCPCGYHGDPRHDCRCHPGLLERYRGRISGPLLDRIDLQVEVAAVPLDELRSGDGERSAPVAERVAAARRIQRRRLTGLRLAGPRRSGPGESDEPELKLNATLSPPQVRTFCEPDPEGRRLLERAYERLALSVRAVHRAQRVARTIADLAGDERIAAPHVAEALQFRVMGEEKAI